MESQILVRLNILISLGEAKNKYSNIRDRHIWFNCAENSKRRISEVINNWFIKKAAEDDELIYKKKRIFCNKNI